jgi:cytochrome c oxidase subunit III
MTTLVTAPQYPGYTSPDLAVRLRRARLGLGVGMLAIMMVFVSFTSAYVVRQGLPTLDPHTDLLVHDWLPLPLPRLLFVNTFLLLISSLTIELARRRVTRSSSLVEVRGVSPTQEKALPWLMSTLVLGMGFLIGQWIVWRDLAADGFYLATGPSSSFLYLLTGTHAVHLLGGIVALLAAAGIMLTRSRAESRAIVVDISSWYWHFMTVLWIYILCLLEFAR